MTTLAAGTAPLPAIGEWLLVVLVFLGALPLLTASYQFLLVGAHRFRAHYDDCRPYYPRVAIIVPAWNEGAVIGTSIDRLLALEYPGDRLRVYVVDDASTDDTPVVVASRVAAHPGRVFHLRRDQGGQGKAHVLNHGIAEVLADDWMEALLIMDADVIFTPPSLRFMTRHLADPATGAVTAYIKEGSRPGNFMTRFIAYEYVTAQAAARRAQNVLGALACLAGGAQLHSRANMEAIGGSIDTSSLAEDTFTTFRTQLVGHRVVFEGNAVVWAEEPDSISGLWRQRLRWARGNVQVTRTYKHLWFRPHRDHRLGGISFGLIWFSLFLQPVFMIASSAALVTLYFVDLPLSWHAFRMLWIVNALTFVFITTFTLLIDTETARRCWRQALFFPGAVSLFFILYACFTRPLRWVVHHLADAVGLRLDPTIDHHLMLVAYVWVSACMVVAVAAKALEPRRLGRLLSPLVVYVAGYGPLLCAVTFTSYIYELRGAERTWEKTEKTGKVAV